MRQSVRKDIPRGDVDGLLKQIMLEDDETGVNVGGVIEDVFPVLEDLANGGGASADAEVVGIECGCGADTRPNDGGQTHCDGDSTDTVTCSILFVK